MENECNFKLDTQNVEQQKAFDLVANTNTCLFITGKAGTGKTTFIKRIQAEINKNFLVLAPTGIAAIAVGGQKAGTPDSNMPVQYEYTGYAWKPQLRSEPTFLSEKWDFSRYQPDVVCINLGTNDLSTNNYDVKLLKQGYQTLLKMVRQHNPQAKIVFLCGSMLLDKELEIAKKILDEVAAEANKAGDKQVYRFDFTYQNGSLGYGNDYHPSIWQHEKMAAELTAYLRSLMQWW
jgi:hypothetical protein